VKHESVRENRKIPIPNEFGVLCPRPRLPGRGRRSWKGTEAVTDETPQQQEDDVTVVNDTVVNDTAVNDTAVNDTVVNELLVEEVSIDGMCGVY
jgi:mycofactocin precursor